MNAMFFFSNSQEGQKEAFSFYIDIYIMNAMFFSISQQGQKEAFSKRSEILVLVTFITYVYIK
jgi:hypothetical protein